MRRKLPIVVLAVVAALATALMTASVAAAGNGGFTPADPKSPNAHHTMTAFWVIVGFTGLIFVLVEGLLVSFIWKYRGRGRSRSVEGPQVHGHTRLELIWTVIPVLILCAIGTVVFFQLPHIDSAPAASASNALHITVEGHQFYWQFDYPDGSRSIDTLYVPANRVVYLRVIATDVIHSWWIPQLGGKIQAIPGRINHTWFGPTPPGTYEGQCAELCGVYHASMIAKVVAYSGAAPAMPPLGQQEWQGLCATCHGNLGQGGYGPNIATNSILTQVASLRRTLRFGVNGPLGPMPPVGDTWTDAQINALVAYVKKHIYKAAPVGG